MTYVKIKLDINQLALLEVIIINIGVIFLTFLCINLDFFFILIFLLRNHKLKDVIVGYVMNVSLVLILSYTIGPSLLKIFPGWILGILGFVPICLVFHDNDESQNNLHHSGIMDVITTYFATCLGCNLSVFLPILMNESISNFIYILIFICILTIIVPLIIKLAINNKYIIKFMNSYGEFAMKICYILIGIYVFFDSGLIDHL